MPDRTFKVHLGNEIRRFAAAIDGDVYGYSSFAAKVAELFPGENLTFKWKDSDGDMITIANLEDFNEALREQPTGVVRLWASGSGATREPSNATEVAPVSPTPTPAPELEPEPEPEPAPPPPPPPIEPVAHTNVVCDRSNQAPLLGTRYHKIGEDYDLNEASFAELSEPEKQFFEIVLYPGATPVPYEPVIHYGVVCDKTNVGPIIGLRFHKIGENYDICQQEFANLDEEEKQKYELIVHPRKPSFPYKRPEEEGGDEAAHCIFNLIKNAATLIPGGATIDVDVSEISKLMNHLQQAQLPHGHGHGRHGQGHGGGRHCGGGQRQSKCGPRQGRCGGGRWAEGQRKAVPAGETLPTGTFGIGSYGEGVEQLQRFLIAQGLMDQQAIAWRAAMYGPWTRKTVANFQRTNKIDVEKIGEYNDATRAALLALAEVNVPPIVVDTTATTSTAAAATSKKDEASAASADDVAADYEKVSPPYQATESVRPADMATSDDTVSATEPPSAPPATAFPTAEPQRYAAELKLLNQMGFMNDELNVTLLDNSRGSLQSALVQLLK